MKRPALLLVVSILLAPEALGMQKEVGIVKTPSHHSVDETVDKLKAGQLCELPRAAGADRREVRIVIYTLERRSPSPWALALKQRLRSQIKALARTYADMPVAADQPGRKKT